MMDIGLAGSAVRTLQQLGWTFPHACGAVANMVVESALNPRAVGDRGHAWGLCQWHGDRRAAIQRGCGISIGSADFTEQLRALDWEIRHLEPKAFAAVSRSGSPYQAAAAFCATYERPADIRRQSNVRGAIAEQIARALGGR